MNLFIHLGLLGCTVLATGILLIIPGKQATRSNRDLAFAMFPFLLLGVLSGLLLSSTGKPLVEWILPALSVLFIGKFAKSRFAFETARWTLLVVAIILFYNFTELVHRNYTAAPEMTRRAAAAQCHNLIRSAGKDLRRSFPAGSVLPEGPVSKYIPNSPYVKNVATLHARHEWHTVFTRLNRVDLARAVLWYPGGEVVSSSQSITIKQSE